MKFAAEIKKLLHIGGQTGKVLVLDGADIVGYRVVESLIDAEFTNLRVGMRTLKNNEDASRGVELVPFVWEDETTYADALKDVKTVFVTLPIKPQNFETHFPKFLNICTSEHVKKVVKLSFYHAMRSKAKNPMSLHESPDYEAELKEFYHVPIVVKHAICDSDLILHKSLDVTILFASHLMSNFFKYPKERMSLEENHFIYGASSGKGVNYVSPNDVADLAAKAILDTAHKRQAYTLTGPSFVTDEEVALLLTDMLGTKITYVECPLDFFDEDTGALEKIKATGIEENFPKGDVLTVLGRDAEKFEDYLKAMDRMTPVEQEIWTRVWPEKFGKPKEGGEATEMTEPTPSTGKLGLREMETKTKKPLETPFMGILNFHTESTEEVEEPKKPLETPFMGVLNFRTESTGEIENPKEPLEIPFMGILNFHADSTVGIEAH